MSGRALVLALLAAASLAACQRGADSGATAKAPAGTGNNASSQAAQTGAGLHGGLGETDGTHAAGAGPAAASQGSTNRTTKSSVGNR